MYSSAVIILKVEPGGYNPCVARLSNTELVEPSLLASSHTVSISFGSKSGLDTIARILPVSGSNKTTAPSASPNAS